MGLWQILWGIDPSYGASLRGGSVSPWPHAKPRATASPTPCRSWCRPGDGQCLWGCSRRWPPSQAEPSQAHVSPTWLRVLRFLLWSVTVKGFSTPRQLSAAALLPQLQWLSFIRLRLQTLTVAYKPWEDFSWSRSSVLSILARCRFSYKASCFQMGNYCTGIYAVLPLSGCVGCHSSMN